WIDAICINQADLEEKASQVGAMNNIFRRASLVSAWLGPSQDAHHVQRRATTEWRAVAEFFRNAWFYRVWIVQEAAVAKK
ncbi:heterokaryon incompatibility, partial [Hyaloscypha variabilis F]